MSSEKAQAIALISGSSDVSIREPFQQALQAFSVKILDVQEILMAKRVILAIHFSLDPAHAPAIEKDLQAVAEKVGLDQALEIL